MFVNRTNVTRHRDTLLRTFTIQPTIYLHDFTNYISRTHTNTHTHTKRERGGEREKEKLMIVIYFPTLLKSLTGITLVQ